MEPGKTELARIGLEQGALLLTLAVALVTDLRYRKIPNWLTFGSALAAIACAGISGGLGAAAFSLLASLLGIAVFFPIFVPGWIGAGDVKLLMAIGAWGGSRMVLDVAVLSIFVGAALGLIGLALSGRLLDFLRRFWIFVRAILYRELELVPFRADRSLRLPFAVPMALAVLGRIAGHLPQVVSGGLPWLR